MTEASGALSEALRTIEDQQKEIDRLQRRLSDERVAEDLRDALLLAASTGAIAAPSHHSRLLTSIVETAARVIPSDAASLFLIDVESQELVFEVALGQKADEVKSFRLPLGHGIAGLVAVSGQPMAITNVESDPRHASDVSQQVGYVPHSILCCPLVYNDETVGVLELLDRRGASAYSPADIDTLWHFANQAAIALEQSRTYQNLTEIITAVVESAGPAVGRSGLAERARNFTRNLEEDRVYRRSLVMADLVRDIAWRGEDEMVLCESILRDIAAFLDSRSITLHAAGGQ